MKWVWMRRRVRVGAAVLAALSMLGVAAAPETPGTRELQGEVMQLAGAVAQSQRQLAASEQEIELLRQQVSALESKLAGVETGQPQVEYETRAREGAARLSGEVELLRERQEIQASELATHEQTKVETVSKFPVRLTGLILANGYALPNRQS